MLGLKCAILQLFVDLPCHRWLKILEWLEECNGEHLKFGTGFHGMTDVGNCPLLVAKSRWDHSQQIHRLGSTTFKGHIMSFHSNELLPGVPILVVTTLQLIKTAGWGMQEYAGISGIGWYMCTVWQQSPHTHNTTRFEQQDEWCRNFGVPVTVKSMEWDFTHHSGGFSSSTNFLISNGEINIRDRWTQLGTEELGEFFSFMV